MYHQTVDFFFFLVAAYIFPFLTDIVPLTIVLLNPNMFSFESTEDLQKPTDQDTQVFFYLGCESMVHCIYLSLTLPMANADNLCKQFVSRSELNIGPDVDPNFWTL